MHRPSLARFRGSFPWFVVAMIALGVGATTAIFSVVNGVMLRPLPFSNPAQLVLLGETSPQVPNAQKFAYFDTPSAYLAWQKQATDFTALAAMQDASFTLAGAGRPSVLHGARVTGQFFDVLGARPELGRLFQVSDETDITHPMVITDALWRSTFNADPGVVGRMIGAPGREARIIGVLPADYKLAGAELGPMKKGEKCDFYITLHFGPEMGGDLTRVWSNFNYTVFGRMRPGVTVPTALAQLNVVSAALAATAPDKDPSLHLYALVTPIRDYAVADIKPELMLLFGGVFAVLLIVCVNLGGLWTSRVADRRRDWAIRSALGADPSRLVRQLLGESIALSLIGGVLGMIAASALLQALVAAAPADIPRLDEVHVDWRVLAFGLVLSLVAGLLTGLVPAFRLGRSDPQESLKAAGAATTADRSSLRSRQFLIGLQAALSTLLLAATGLLGFSFYQLMTRPAGFNPDHAMAASIVENTYTDLQRNQILKSLPAAVAAIPGVESVGFTSHLPLSGETWIDGAGAPGKTYPSGQEPDVNVRFISPGYLRAIGIPLLAGRDFTEADRPAGWPPKDEAADAKLTHDIIISRATALRIFPATDLRTLVGQKMVLNDQQDPIIGITADALDGSLDTAVPDVVYQPYWEYPPAGFSLVVRSALPVSALAAPLREAVWKLAPNAPIPLLQPLTGLRDTAVASQRYQLSLLLAFAALALFLAGLGVYALVAHSVVRRAREFAIRRSLGAPGSQLSGLILRQALFPVLAGSLAGLIAALLSGQLLASFLYHVSPTSSAVLAPVTLAVLLAAAAACILPARRALRADPWRALRAE